MCLGLGYRGANILLGTSLGTENRFLGHYYDFDQLLLRAARRCVSWRGIFGRFGISDGKANPSHQFYSFGIVSGVCRDYPNAARFGVRLNCSNTADDEAAEVQKQEHSRE